MFDLDCQFVSKTSSVLLLLDVSIVTHLGKQIIFCNLKISFQTPEVWILLLKDS